MAKRIDGNRLGFQAELAEARYKGLTVGFVPTMGFLHEGHCALIRESARHNDRTVVSIFVNPTQFGPNEDLATYPRGPQGDYQKSIAAGADWVWYPEETDLYPVGWQTRVQPGELAHRLCGLSRPAFFGGICSVVLRLFNIVQPHRSYFGEKDFQQLTIIKKMVADLFLPVEVVGCPTVREPDGLAMSSRNARLKPAERHIALGLWRCLSAAREAFAAGQQDAGSLVHDLRHLWPQEIELDYLEFRDPVHLDLVSELEADTRLFLAGWLNGVRLIDNGALVDPR